MRNVYVVTHTESIHHIRGLGGGWYDTSLTEKGVAQATNIAATLYNHLKIPDIPIYSSDLKRASETADIFARIFKSTVIIDKRLREMSYGDAEGKPKDWQDQNITPQPINGDRLNHHVFNNSESRKDVGTRIQSFLSQIADKLDDNVMLITHGFVLTFIIMAWLKVPVENMDYCNFQSNPGRVTLLHEDDFLGNRTVVYTNRALLKE